MVFRASVVLLSLAMTPLSAQEPPPTPNDDDIPSPVPVEVSLAGDPLPDITRFLRVRTANAPSLSPDGRRLAFQTSITGEPHLWVVDAQGRPVMDDRP